MSDKVNVIARKIYEEGLEKAQLESEEIIKDAKDRAKKIIEEANSEAENILKKAKENAENKKTIINSEISLASRQLLDTLKQKIKNLISDKVLKEGVKNAFDDPKFVQKLILEIATNWSKEDSLSISINENVVKEIEEALKSSLKKDLKGLTISISKEPGFTISDVNEGFQIEFNDKQFMNFLSPYLKESTQHLIFN
jgi:V/A-type H+-transporting ATPase subunit E